MIVTTHDMNCIVDQIWTAIVHADVVPVPPADFDGRVIAATVTLHGTEPSNVLVRCEPELAARVAASMFNLEPESLDDDDLHDTVGELANIVAGNVKAIAGSDQTLSIPVVTDGPATHIDVPQDGVVQDDHYLSEGGRIAVTAYVEA